MSPDVVALLTVTINGLIAIALAYLGYKSSEAARIRRENGIKLDTVKELTADLPNEFREMISKQKNEFLANAVKAAHELAKRKDPSR